LGNEGFCPEVVAYFFTAMMPWLNFLTLVNIIELEAEKSITDTVLIGVIYAIYLVLNYIYFFRKDRYKIFLSEAKHTSHPKSKMLLTVLYIALSLSLHFYFSDLRRAMGDID